MSTPIATGRLLVSRAATLRRTVCALPRASLALHNAGPSAVRPFSLYSLMRASAASASAKKAPSKSKSSAKTITKKKTTTAAAAKKKKPAAKAKAKKPKAKKPKAKKTVKKKAVKKVPKKRATKPLTEEQKEKRELLKLKKMALLKGPARLPGAAWTVYVSKNVRKGVLTDQITSLAASFKNISESERQELQRIADSNKAENVKTYKNWISSFPPEVIYMANLARKRLAHKFDKNKSLLHDERQPTRALTAYVLYVKDTYVKQEGVKPNERFSQIGERWKSLSDEEKSPYLEAASSAAEKSSAQRKEFLQKATAYWKDQE